MAILVRSALVLAAAAICSVSVEVYTLASTKGENWRAAIGKAKSNCNQWMVSSYPFQQDLSRNGTRQIGCIQIIAHWDQLIRSRTFLIQQMNYLATLVRSKFERSKTWHIKRQWKCATSDRATPLSNVVVRVLVAELIEIGCDECRMIGSGSIRHIQQVHDLLTPFSEIPILAWRGFHSGDQNGHPSTSCVNKREDSVCVAFAGPVFCWVEFFYSRLECPIGTKSNRSVAASAHYRLAICEIQSEVGGPTSSLIYELQDKTQRRESDSRSETGSWRSWHGH